MQGKRQDCQSNPRTGHSGLPGHHPLSGARSGHVPVVDESGLRAKEMASLTWAMVTDAADRWRRCSTCQPRQQRKTGGRTIPPAPGPPGRADGVADRARGHGDPERPILFSERGGGLSAATVRLWFHRLYTSLKMDGCSSHSGRRTFITRAARKVSQVGGSLRDVQELAGHTSLAMTQRYIEGDTEAKRKLVAPVSQVHYGALCVAVHSGLWRDPCASSGASTRAESQAVWTNSTACTPAAAERTGGMGQRQAPPAGA